MDAVTVVEPLIDEAAPVVAEGVVHALYATGNIIVIDAKDLKTFAIKAGVVAVWGGVMYWSWKKTWQPEWEEHKQRKVRKQVLEARARAEERLQKEQAKTNGFELYKVILKQRGTDKKTPVTVKVPVGTTYKEAVELARQGKAELVD